MRLLAQSYDPIKIKITIDFVTSSEITSNRLIARSLDRRIIDTRDKGNEIYRNFYFNRIVQLSK